MLEDILSNRSAHRLYSFLTLHAESSFYDKEISEKTGVSRGMTNKLLNAFLSAGLVERERKGRMWFYSLKPSPLPRQYRIYENLASLQALVKDLEPLVKRIVLYGSAATGEDSAESDIDLFVITEQKEAAIKKIRKFVSDREIAPVVETPAEYAMARSKDKAFFDQVAEGLVLYEAEADEQRL